MTPDEIRLECLKLAVERGPARPDIAIPSARLFEAYVTGGTAGEPADPDSRARAMDALPERARRQVEAMINAKMTENYDP